MWIRDDMDLQSHIHIYTINMQIYFQFATTNKHSSMMNIHQT